MQINSFVVSLLISLAIPHLVHAQEILIGQTASLRNPLVRDLASDYSAGIELALSHANATGGVKGRKVRLVVAEDNFDAKQTITAVDDLVEKHNVLALVGPMGTQPVLRLADSKTLERHQLAAIGPFTGLQEALARPNVFPVRGSYEDEVKTMLQHSTRLGPGKVAFVYYEAGVGPHLAKLVPQMAVEAKANLIQVTGYPVVADPKAQQAAVSKALDKFPGRPESLILLAIGPAHSEALKVIRDRFGLGMPVYSLGQVTPHGLVRDVGAGLAWGTMLTQVMPMPGIHHPMKIVREFEADRKQYAPTKSPGYVLLEGYIVGRVAIEVLSRAKTLTPGGVLKAAEHAGQMNVAGFLVDYGPESRRSVNPIELTMMGRDGALIR